MSIPVEQHELREALERYGTAAFLLTGGDDGRPHVSHVQVVWDGEALRVRDAGGRTRGNAVQRPKAALMWPPVESGGYSLIADVGVVLDGADAVLHVERAVLHRPAPARDAGEAARADGSCGHDCRPLGP